MKRLVAFDLDGTLAESKQGIDREMAGLLARLSRWATVAVISGGDWPQFKQQLVEQLPPDIDLTNWFLLPTCGTKLYRHDGGWSPVFADLLQSGERAAILAAFVNALESTSLTAQKVWGNRIEDRGSQITFSGLGQQAPLAAKQAWDPDFSKRRRLQAILAAALPGFAVRIGGSTSIDITRAGIDKAYGMGRLAEISGIRCGDMIFVGDAIFPDGNDYAVHQAGIDTIAVRNVDETKRVIEAIILCLACGSGRPHLQPPFLGHQAIAPACVHSAIMGVDRLPAGALSEAPRDLRRSAEPSRIRAESTFNRAIRKSSLEPYPSCL